jgi:hypothetical protein
MRIARPIHVPRSSLLLATTLLGLSLLPFPRAPASASCAAPYVELEERELLVHDSPLTVEGRSFTGGGCQDSMGCTETLGCQHCEYDDPPATPMENVELRLTQGTRTWLLDTADAGSAEDNHLGWVVWSFDLPHGVHSGPARVKAEGVAPVQVVVR